jgi:hypothetical protein
MNNEDLFLMWAPPGGRWSDWVKPVAFAQIPKSAGAMEKGHLPDWRTLPADWLAKPSDTALVIDLPGPTAIAYAVAAAHRGWRPVPLFNACTGAAEVVNMQTVIRALHEATYQLPEAKMRDDAPPAFLLDAGRLPLDKPLRPGVFDNRWMVFPQDFPSASYLQAQQIQRVLVVRQTAKSPLEDLSHVLRRWQEAGIEILQHDPQGTADPQKFDVKPPPKYRSLWHRLLAMTGLRRSAAGGFGSIIPQPSSGGG